MKYRLRDVIDNVDEDDIYKMKSDLESGGIHLRNLLKEKIKNIEKQKARFCATCGQELNDKEKTYTLLFGREDFKKKASFCEIDCLEYFLANLKKTEKEVQNTDEKQ